MESIDHRRWLERIESALHDLRQGPRFDRAAVPEEAQRRDPEDAPSSPHSRVAGDVS
jgi:hypothetical protein